MLVRSEILLLEGVRHAFSTRTGGVSRGPYASLNLGRSVGDDPAAVEENRRRFALAAGFDGPDRLAEVSQVHGAGVVRATSGPHASGALSKTEADGLWTDEPGLGVGVRTADCVPVLMVALDERGRAAAVAAIHAGWRGACAGVIAAAVEALGQGGHPADRLLAALGPAIGLSAFEVGDEVIEAASESLGGEAPRTVPGPRGRPHLDLPDLVRRHLHRAGVQSHNVQDLGLCTGSDPLQFFSHRRDGGLTGRHISAIQLLR